MCQATGPESRSLGGVNRQVTSLYRRSSIQYCLISFPPSGEIASPERTPPLLSITRIDARLSASTVGRTRSRPRWDASPRNETQHCLAEPEPARRRPDVVPNVPPFDLERGRQPEPQASAGDDLPFEDASAATAGWARSQRRGTLDSDAPSRSPASYRGPGTRASCSAAD
jgi:hypothetical protein